jgi:hypothetical protein
MVICKLSYECHIADDYAARGGEVV